MSESGFHRPRRALAHDTDSDEPTAADDTPGDSDGAARRGADSHSSEQASEGGQQGDDVAQEPGTSASSASSASSEQGNPFARPGSESAATSPAPTTEPLVPAPVPAMPGPEFEDVGDTGSRRRMNGLDDGPTGVSPAPRRSAVSSATPPEKEPLAAHAGSGGSGGSDSWVHHHKRTLLIWGIGALVAALLLVFGFYLAGRNNAAEPTPPVSASPSPSTSVSAVPEVSGEDLLTVADADKIVGGASWAVINTALTREEATAKVACLSTDLSDVNPTDTFQRSMGTSQDDQLAALQQVDVYANAGAAQQVQMQRTAALAACDEVPAHIESSTTITGLGDDVTQVTVAFQDIPTTFRTVLLVRTGRALTMLDVTRHIEAVDVEGAVAGLVRSLSSICSRVDGMCPTDPVVTAAVPPPVDPQGWLITSDLPRVRPGYGRWTALPPADITSQGMGCENLPLATEPGPTDRAQRTYLLTQDDMTPETFGIDEMVFDFPDNTQARLFANKLIKNLLSCKERVLTAKVTDLNAINGTGADGVALSTRMITIDQAISDNSSVRFQLFVSIADNRVSYLLASVTDSYEFSPGRRNGIALRTAERLSQG